MRLYPFAFLALSLLACGDDGDDGDDDTDGTPIDAAPDGTAVIDGSPDSSGATCTGALYEACAGNTDCDSANCHDYNDIGMVCTQTCTPGNNATCPQPTGGTANCNNMGICKPNAPIACTP